jgi:hypothetical protein
LEWTDVSEEHTVSIISPVMMDTVRSPETSVHFKEATRRYIPEDSKLHSRRRENLKSYESTNMSPISYFIVNKPRLYQIVYHTF